MRIDSFLNATNLVKRRSIAQDMCASQVVEINGVPAKSGREVKVGDVITLRFLEYTKYFQILSIPSTRTTPKSQMYEFVREIDSPNV